MKELAALAYRDTTPESRDFWKNEMAQAIREIEAMYADKLDTMKTEMESSYNLKVRQANPPCLDPPRPHPGGAAYRPSNTPHIVGYVYLL